MRAGAGLHSAFFSLIDLHFAPKSDGMIWAKVILRRLKYAWMDTNVSNYRPGGRSTGLYWSRGRSRGNSANSIHDFSHIIFGDARYGVNEQINQKLGDLKL
jgi:hypothetical protein